MSPWATLTRELKSVVSRLEGLDTRAPDRHGDDADSITAQETHNGQVHSRATLLERKRFILTALVKLDRGDYGICEGCGRRIGAKRLAAIPWAIFCLSCASADEIRDQQFRKAAGLPRKDEDGQ